MESHKFLFLIYACLRSGLLELVRSFI